MNNFFEKIYCPNLIRRPDRRTESEREFLNAGIEVEFIIAIDGKDLKIEPFINEKSIDRRPISKGDMGCTLTHLRMCSMAKSKRYKNYLVLEDDAEFSGSAIEIFNKAIKELPDNWGMLYLGGSHIVKPIPISEHIGIVKKTYTSHAVAFNHTAYDELIKYWGAGDERIDLVLANLQNKIRSYCIMPSIVYQRASHSDIIDRFADYKHLRS